MEYVIERKAKSTMFNIRPANGGATPKALSGLYLKQRVAQEAIDAYLASKPEKVDYSTPDTPEHTLELLTKKNHLLEFAELYNIDVPPSMKQPASIKKFIKEQLENV